MMAPDPLIIHRMAMKLRETLLPQSRAVVLVSSARPAEGKSTVTGLLARALAAQGQGALLLVDGGSSVGVGLGGPVISGVERVLEGSELLPELLRADKAGRVHRLGHGPQFRATAWFQPSPVAGLVARCRDRFALTLIDGPSLPACGALLTEADRVVLVVDAQRTSGSIVQAALAEARLNVPRLAGVVLNRQSAALPRWLGG